MLMCPIRAKKHKLKVGIKAISSGFEGIDWNGVAYESVGWGTDFKEYSNIVVSEPSNATTQLKFKIVLKNNHSNGREYIITL